MVSNMGFVAGHHARWHEFSRYRSATQSTHICRTVCEPVSGTNSSVGDMFEVEVFIYPCVSTMALCIASLYVSIAVVPMRQPPRLGRGGAPSPIASPIVYRRIRFLLHSRARTFTQTHAKLTVSNKVRVRGEISVPQECPARTRNSRDLP